MRSKEQNKAHINEKLPQEDSGVDVVDKNCVGNSNKQAVQVLKTLCSLLPLSKYLKSGHIVELINKFNRFLLVKTILTTVQQT